MKMKDLLIHLMIRTMTLQRLFSTLTVLSASFTGFLGVAHAGERSSANYSIVAEATDIGGHEVVSPNYTNIGSVGLIAGISSGEDGKETVAKSGYIAQLYSVAGLMTDPDLLEVNETATNQMFAYATLDDDTLLALLPTEVSWSVLSGPIEQIDANGLVSTGNVYENTTAEVKATWGAYQSQSSFSILNVGDDDYGTYAGDGLVDGWQVLHFGESNPLAGHGLDPDGDGSKNWEEFIMGTVPTDGGSVFRPLAHYSGNQLELTIPTITGRKYQVKTSADLKTWNLHEEFSGDGNVKVSTITDLDTMSKFFYRIEVSEE